MNMDKVRGKRIVGVKQRQRRTQDGENVYDVIYIELEDGTRLCPYIAETAGEPAVVIRLSRSRQKQVK